MSSQFQQAYELIVYGPVDQANEARYQRFKTTMEPGRWYFSPAGA